KPLPKSLSEADVEALLAACNGELMSARVSGPLGD
ncbi:hypothetical protein Pgy4_41624, partial [Pseudomonas savastanoi pv. glycinea str. race 4]